MKVTAEGEGVDFHAGRELLRELAGFTGLIDAWNRALTGTYKAMPVRFPGSVLVDLSVMIVDGARCISDLRILRDKPQLFAAVASTPTGWRVLDRVKAAHLPLIRAGHGLARQRAWEAGSGPDLTRPPFRDVDATIVIAHSEKENAAPTWKRTFGFHPPSLLSRPASDRRGQHSGKALAGHRSTRQRSIEHRS
jgi:hypothetical protein